MKFAPVIVSVVVRLPASICLGLKSVMRGRPFTALKALAMPVPQIDVVQALLPPGKALTVFCKICVTWAGVAVGINDRTSDAMPGHVRRRHAGALIVNVSIRAGRGRPGVERGEDAVRVVARVLLAAGRGNIDHTAVVAVVRALAGLIGGGYGDDIVAAGGVEVGGILHCCCPPRRPPSCRPPRSN